VAAHQIGFDALPVSGIVFGEMTACDCPTERSPLLLETCALRALKGASDKIGECLVVAGHLSERLRVAAGGVHGRVEHSRNSCAAVPR
jgi:hypothetical protein